MPTKRLILLSLLVSCLLAFAFMFIYNLTIGYMEPDECRIKEFIMYGFLAACIILVIINENMPGESEMFG